MSGAEDQRIQALEQQISTLTDQLVQITSSVAAGGAGARSHAPSGLPSTVKVEKPQSYKGQYDAAILGTFLYQCELYFAVTQVQGDSQRVGFATLLLTGDAAVWLRTRFTPQQLGAVSWADFTDALRRQFLPIDHVRIARDELAGCVQTGTVQGYSSAFRRTLVKCTDVSPAEALDRFVRGLKPQIKQLVLVHAPTTFEEAAQYADRVASAGRLGVVPQQSRGASSSSGPTPMELGYAEGRQRGSGRSWSQGQSPGQSSARTTSRDRSSWRCHYCKQPGHFRRECPKLGQKNQSRGH